MGKSTPQLTEQEKMEQIKRVMLMNALSPSGVLSSRLRYGNTKTFDGLRDVYTALGYPGLDQISFSDYYIKFRRQDVAGKIVEKPVEGSWRLLPTIRATEDESGNWRSEWEALDKELGIFRHLVRLDTIAGIGRYGCLLMGFDDGAASPMEPVERATRLLYLQPFSEGNAFVKEWETDPQNSRFGLPRLYGLRISNTPDSSQGQALESIYHHSRVLHVAEGCLESNVYGIPRLERAYNRLLNLELIAGGSAEMFWQGAFPGLAFKVAEDFDISQIASELSDEIQKYVHQMERYMKLQGIDVQQLAPVVADPASHIDVQLKMISIATGIPKRILEGSERGELASSQDSESWDAQCDYRRKTYVEPTIIRPFINKLIEVGILDEPTKGYEIEWPDLTSPSEQDKAAVGKTRAEAWRTYTSVPDAQMMMPMKTFLEEIMELSTEKVERIMVEIEALQDQLFAGMEEESDDDEDAEQVEEE